MTSKLVLEALERAGLGTVLARRERGEVPDDDEVVELLAGADILALGTAADVARRRECGPEVRIFMPSAPPANAIGSVLGEREAARGTENLLPPLREALAAMCTVGEVCGVLRDEWGTYDRAG